MIYLLTNINIILQFGFAVRLFVRKLLRRLQTNRRQTWQEDRGRVDLEPKGMGYHGHQVASMVTKKR